MNTIRRLLSLLIVCLGFITLSACSVTAHGEDPADPRALRDFSEAMAARHGMDADAVERLIRDEARHQPEIIEAISNPAEALPWYRYRRIFLTEDRIAAGVDYWDEHAGWLSAAQARYGVPPAVIVAIIGVETLYGRYRGRHRVIDSLRTLGFAYPPRADFFRSELEEFLVLADEEGMDPTTPLGSYAGAMGVPQFISSSYRAYAVDFNENGRRDLFSETADAIGSVGHYLALHGWQADAPVAVPARVDGMAWQAFLRTPLEPVDTVAGLEQAGVQPQRPLEGGQSARLLALERENGTEYWVTLQNFYAITRYNHSALYAMAVHQLADAIREARQ